MATAPRRPEIMVEIGFGKSRRRVWLRADRNAAAAFRAYVDGFMRDAIQAELAEIAHVPSDSAATQ